MLEREKQLSKIKPHMLLNAFDLLTSPRYVERDGYSYRRYTLYLVDECVPGGFRLVGAVFAIDRRDAWHTFVNMCVLSRSATQNEYTFLD